MCDFLPTNFPAIQPLNFHIYSSGLIPTNATKTDIQSPLSGGSSSLTAPSINLRVSPAPTKWPYTLLCNRASTTWTFPQPFSHSLPCSL